MSEGNPCPNGAAKEPAAEHKLCDTCPMAVRDEWRARWGKMRSHVRCHDLTLLELQVMQFLVDKTYGWGKRELITPQIKLLCSLVNMDDTALGRTLKKLHGRRMIFCVQKKGMLHFSVNENVNVWGAAKADDLENIQADLNRLRMFNGMPSAAVEEDAALNFKNRLPAHFFGASLDKQSLDESTASSTDYLPNLL